MPAGAEETTNILGPGVTIPGPRFRGVPVDSCLRPGRDCGQPAAEAYCKTRGFPAAASFATGKVARTWMIGEAKDCRGPECTALTQVVCARIEGIRVSDPSVGKPLTQEAGLLADGCRTWGKDCGEEAARAYCRTKGYSFVRAWKIHSEYRGPTFIIGSKQTCNVPVCRALSNVECSNAPTPAKPATR